MQEQEDKKREKRGALGKCIVLRRTGTGPYERGLRVRLLNRNYGQGYVAKPFVGKGLAVQIHTGKRHLIGRGTAQLGSLCGTGLGLTDFDIAGKLALGIEVTGHCRTDRTQHTTQVFCMVDKPYSLMVQFQSHHFTSPGI